MSVYSNETISHRFAGVFSAPRLSLSNEMKAILGALAVWAVLFGIIEMQAPENGDLHSSSNLEEIRIDLPETERAQAQRQHY
jgi:hypothetical protein